ncbi:ubiquitin-conjugating enzyme/RWD-like protein [Mycena vulgaris]|nr:ubiquitin-conjugating enzyme/RWD-like protein [Mycena vulgaris]
MHSNDATHASKKRKRSSSPEGNAGLQKTSALIRRSIVLLAATSDLPAASFSPLLNTLNEAYQSALSDEAQASGPLRQRPEDWNWELTAEQIVGLTQEELTIWKDLLVCRESLRLAGITVHPVNWAMPVADLTQWVAHIPGLRDTPWEGGVYSLQMTFHHCSSECVPKFRFSPPLFHPNTYPSGTWGYTSLERALINYPQRGQTCDHDIWLNAKHKDPVRFATFLKSIQKSLNEPEINSPAQSDAYTVAKKDPKAYEARIRAQAEAWKPDPLTGLAGRPILQPIKQEP